MANEMLPWYPPVNGIVGPIFGWGMFPECVAFGPKIYGPYGPNTYGPY